uniref:DUF8077 domain-containing protein n=1 Tax=Acrobeloides nanus TaxID=290746 RepID=A0A914CU60_9BILA
MAFYLITFILIFILDHNSAQYAGGDRTTQELSLLEWSSGIRIGNCQEDASGLELIEPLKRSLARMITRHCKNSSACRLREPVEFSAHQIVLFDGYPRRENRGVNFRFFVILPYNAIPIEKKIDKPLLSSKILADVLRAQHSEFSNVLGWHVISYEKFPRFDPVTTFMNRALIPIGVVAALFMLFLAYWSSTISSSTYAGGEGWSVSGSTGGKNAAYRRTLEIIEEQRKKLPPPPPPSEKLKAEHILVGDGYSRRPEVILDVNRVSFEGPEPRDALHEAIVFQPRESISTTDSNLYAGRTAAKHFRRPSVIDEHRREKRKTRSSMFAGRPRDKSIDGPKRWKAGSIMLSQF